MARTRRRIAARDVAATEPRFWRDAALPFIEARSIEDGRRISYARHAHDTFSIGIIARGESRYLNGRTRERVGPGSVVVMNPGDTHVCNPIGDQPWAYRMLYVDTARLAGIQGDLGVCHDDRFQPFATTWTLQPGLYACVSRTHDVLTDPHASNLEKEGAAIEFMLGVQRALHPASPAPRCELRGVALAAEFIRDNFTRSIKLHEIGLASGLSASYLIRAFRQAYGMTPHAYVMNCRIEFCRSQLRSGRSIVDVAHEAGFSDQAHLQRSFKKFVAATPGQYRGAMSGRLGNL